MEKLFEWLLTNGDKLSVSGLLLALLVFVVLGLSKQWFVPGPMYKDCMKAKAYFEAESVARAKEIKEKADKLEQKLQDVQDKKDRDRYDLERELQDLRDENTRERNR